MKYAGEVATTARRLSVALFKCGAAVVVGAALLTLLLNRAEAQLHEVMLRLGASAMSFPGAHTVEPRTLVLNGIAVSLRTQVVDASLPETLRHYRDLCAKGGDAEEWYGGLLSGLAVRSAIRRDDGYVACVQFDSWSLSTLAARAAKFVETWDLADLGAPRYVYASRADDRPEDRTFVLTMWSDGPTNLRNLLPIDRKDAVGADPPGVRRPQASQRILSATEVSEPAGVYSYLVRDQSPGAIEQLYRKELSEGSWRILERVRGEAREVDGIHVLSAERGERLLTVIAYPSVEGGTTVTFLDWSGT